MRHLITLGLCLGVVASAAAQTEVIIRRPGEKDQVIQLDSARAREALARAKVELRHATTSIQQHLQEMEKQLTRDQMKELPTRINTLALRNTELATRNMIEPLMARLTEIRRQARLGIVVTTVPRETDKWGAYVTSVTPGGPADKAGILSGDVIIRIAGKSLTEKPAKGEDKDDSSPGLRLISIVSQLEPGKPVDVELRRGSQNRTVKVTPVEDDMPSIARVMPERPATGTLSWTVPGRELSMMPEAPLALESPSINVFSGGGPGSFFYSFSTNGLFSNLELVSLNEKLGSYFGTNEGVLVVNTMNQRSNMIRPLRSDSNRVMVRRGVGAGVKIQADTIEVRPRALVDIGLEPGDVIVSVDGRKVTTPSQLMRIVGTYDRGDEFKLQIMRQKRAETLTVKMP